MYESFYDLHTRPFLTVPDPDFIYWSEEHTFAFTMLRYSLISRSQISVITGDIGSGKTTLLRHLLREIPEDIEIGLISNMQAGRGDLLQWVMLALDQEPSNAPYIELFRRFQNLLIERYAEGKRVVLIFDEAQNMTMDSLEELRMLSNINSDKDELIQIILVGQPELRSILKRPELTQFAQRIASDFNMTAMTAYDVRNYIHHRLEIAGAKWRIFPDRCCELIHAATRGVPRLVNILCDLCLVSGFSDDQKVITEPLLRSTLNGLFRRGLYDQFGPLPDGPVPLRQHG
jgi:type II secretory pathway predicted ATPase ExeA